MNKDTTFAIVGLGLLGGSYAKGLKEAGYHVYGVARREETITYALEHNYIDEGSIDPALVAKADIIICCLYPSILIKWIEDNKKFFKPSAIISDVSGVKHTIVEPIQEILTNTTNEFIATHPMAGRETSGIEYANTEMFKSANFIIVPTEKNTQHAIDTMWSLAEILAFHHISILSIEEHDRMIGFLSQLTHVIAVSLMNTHDDEKLVDYTGDSFRDLTRIAKINEHMWSELFLYNKEILLDEITKFQESLSDFKETLQTENIDKMKMLFTQSTKRRKKFDK
ncbi:prephenate dehydrogenase [Breznakia sp. PF5-3]|uniref:prephenate dehydrogenase n=1 Tax=unclassified Breznakia TaxID=2623764 RepID=UPI0029E259C7|nr:prephenate dehydrogenase [Breznakia sp. PM6-1]MDF9836134.1 prephenate dehydrogenase [Breznakia sp. PF5-3]MDF9838179.1 prephenate dehydrogenase [Breznakia sp. PFB2-8]MDF9860165.1 prephenate dehydrogenase [Breznakia sp. PH5-24]